MKLALTFHKFPPLNVLTFVIHVVNHFRLWGKFVGVLKCIFIVVSICGLCLVNRLQFFSRSPHLYLFLFLLPSVLTASDWKHLSVSILETFLQHTPHNSAILY